MSYGFGIFYQDKLFKNIQFCKSLNALQDSTGTLLFKYNKSQTNIAWDVVDKQSKDRFLSCVEYVNEDTMQLFNKFIYHEMVPDSAVFIGQKVGKNEYRYSNFGLYYIEQLFKILDDNFKFYNVGFWIYFQSGSKGVLPFKITETTEIQTETLKPNEVNLIKINNSNS